MFDKQISRTLAVMVVIAAVVAAIPAVSAAQPNTQGSFDQSSAAGESSITGSATMHLQYDGELHVVANYEGQGTATLTVMTEAEGTRTYEVDGERGISVPAPEDPSTVRMRFETEQGYVIVTIEFDEQSIDCVESQETVLVPVSVSHEWRIETPAGVEAGNRTETFPSIAVDCPSTVVNDTHADGHELLDTGFDRLTETVGEGTDAGHEGYNESHDGALSVYETLRSLVWGSYEDTRETGDEAPDRADEARADAERDLDDAHQGAEDDAAEAHEDAERRVDDHRDHAERDATGLVSRFQGFLTQLQNSVIGLGTDVREDAESDADRLRGDVASDADRLRGDVESDTERTRSDAESDVDTLRSDAEGDVDTITGEVERLDDDAPECSVDADADAGAHADENNVEANAGVEATASC